ncbi:hypothetical protein B1218_36335, partial [Pseudomonas ogarae]
MDRGGSSAVGGGGGGRGTEKPQAYGTEQAQRARGESCSGRFKAQGTKARRAQSRVKALGRMEELSAAHVDWPFDFVFRE